ncbi:unnamed protein product [Chrysodeixis includens]|uniref:Uncharacterized protein n=1 Tax=Chrysodeixis includens TaxID=689277 RepID=A0A9P0C600_CHRIL|nr:unnamed protein product [Chrysodeixis includens]
MYRIVVVACAVVSLTAGLALPDESQARILSYDSTIDPDGSYRFSYETSNGITRTETGNLVNAGQENEHIAVSGSYTYTDTDGEQVAVFYSADENGYKIDTPLNRDRNFQPHVVATLLGK